MTEQIWHIGQSAIGRVQRYPRRSPVRMRLNVAGIFRRVAERRLDAKSKIGFGYFDHRCVHYQGVFRGANKLIKLDQFWVSSPSNSAMILRFASSLPYDAVRAAPTSSQKMKPLMSSRFTLASAIVQEVVDPSFRASLLRLRLGSRRAPDGR